MILKPITQRVYAKQDEYNTAAEEIVGNIEKDKFYIAGFIKPDKYGNPFVENLYFLKRSELGLIVDSFIEGKVIDYLNIHGIFTYKPLEPLGKEYGNKLPDGIIFGNPPIIMEVFGMDDINYNKEKSIKEKLGQELNNNPNSPFKFVSIDVNKQKVEDILALVNKVKTLYY